MQRKLLFLLLITALVPCLMFASGKIKGKVVDAGSGEPLVGANVLVVGTSMGAATNVSGEFTVLSVPAGTYTLKTSYVGYQVITLSNVRVNDELTTESNFKPSRRGSGGRNDHNCCRAADGQQKRHERRAHHRQ